MVGFLHVHKVAQFNSQVVICYCGLLFGYFFSFNMFFSFICYQVPVILDASTFSLKLQKRRSLVLERLNQAPVEGSSGVSYGTSGSCSSSTGSPLDF